MVAIAEPVRRYVTIGRVEELVGVTQGTLRQWERAGLIPAAARLEGHDRRIYDEQAVAEIRRVVRERQGRRMTSAA